jgi:co-chaperonin GroES (HSP10)
MKIQPLHDQLVVAPIADGKYTKGGLLVPDVARDSAPYRFADVLEVGTGRTNNAGVNIPCVCKAGDVIAFAKGAGIEFPLRDAEGEEKVVLLLSEKYVLGIVHDLPRPSLIYDRDGELMRMSPQSSALPDSVYKNRDELDRATVDWGVDTSDHVDEETTD